MALGRSDHLNKTGRFIRSKDIQTLMVTSHFEWDGPILYRGVQRSSSSMTVQMERVPAVKLIAAGSFVTLRSLSGFRLNWSHIVRVGDCAFLFYDSVTGTGAMGRLETDGSFKTLRSYPDGSFSLDWTHIVATSDNALLFYNNKSGYVETGFVDDTGIIQTTPRTSFTSGFTNIAAAGHSLLFFYNKVDGLAQLVRLHRAENFKILKSWPPRKFSPNWTHVIGGSNGLLLFYQEETGEGVTGGFISRIH